MNKKICELLKKLVLCEGLFDYTLTPNECSILVDYIKKQQNRINKAIEYIKENEKEYGSLEDNEKIILEILTGGNNGSKM